MCDVALYVGDDTTDLDAFRTLRQLVDAEASSSTRSASASARRTARPEIASEADVVVDGTAGVRELLSMLIVDVRCASRTSSAPPF